MRRISCVFARVPGLWCCWPEFREPVAKWGERFPFTSGGFPYRWGAALDMRPIRSPMRLIESPMRVIRSPMRVSRSPTRVIRSPTRLVRSPMRVIGLPIKVTRTSVSGSFSNLFGVRRPGGAFVSCNDSRPVCSQRAFSQSSAKAPPGRRTPKSLAIQFLLVASFTGKWPLAVPSQ